MSNIINIENIINMIPHRYPFLLIDRIVDFEADKYAIGLKNVTISEPHFQGHFPSKPIMPGVLVIEAMAQTSAVLVVETLKNQTEDKLVYFMSIENAKFRKIITPGDSLYLHVHKDRNKNNVWKFNAEAKVDDVLVAEATFTAMIVNK